MLYNKHKSWKIYWEYLSENLIAPEIEPGTSGSVARNSNPSNRARLGVCTAFNRNEYQKQKNCVSEE
jgi:hypothetical protein